MDATTDPIDLTHPLSESTIQVYPGDPPYTCRPISTVADHGCSIHALCLGSHTGTHIDAPSHFIAGGRTIDQIPLSTLTGPAIVVDLTRQKLKERQMVEWDDIKLYASRMREGAILLLCTGWSQYWGTPKYYAHPFLSVDAAKRILETGIKVIGVDTLNPDETPYDGIGSSGEFGVHKAILGADGVIAENLTNLQTLIDEKCIVALIPLNLAGSDGSPIRAIAWKA